MILFNFGIATEPNNYENKEEDQVWIKDDRGQLILVEVKDDVNNKK